MAFADDLAAINSFHFFKEFTFSTTTFRPKPNQEVELADSIIWLGDILGVFQLKERKTLADTTPVDEERWFNRKVLRQATRQIRDTLDYLKSNRQIQIINHRGRWFNLSLAQIRRMHKLVVYLPSERLPTKCKNLKHHTSRTAGIIHLLQGLDYLGIVRTLLTPAEVSDYFEFREIAINRWPSEVIALPEQALVGQYLSGDTDTPPDIAFIEYLRQIDHRTDEWDVSGIISVFPERITAAGSGTDYYQVVRELALLKRNELREFKSRFELSMAKAKANEFALPYRIAVPRTGCGFVFIPLTSDLVQQRRNALQNFTLAHKYDQHLAKCIGASFSPDNDGWFFVEWCYVEFPWQEDDLLEEQLRSNNPFRSVKSTEIRRYHFKAD